MLRVGDMSFEFCDWEDGVGLVLRLNRWQMWVMGRVLKFFYNYRWKIGKFVVTLLRDT